MVLLDLAILIHFYFRVLSARSEREPSPKGKSPFNWNLSDLDFKGDLANEN